MRSVIIALCLTAATAFVPHHGPMMATSVRTNTLTVLASEPDFGEASMSAPSEPSFDSEMSAPAPREPKLFVANLNFNTSDEDLMEMFSEFGTVTEAHHVNDRFDPEKRRGFGFIMFENMESAAAAVEAMNEKEIMGRNLVVDFAAAKGEVRPKRERAPAARRAPRVDDTGRRVYVGNLDYATSDETLNMIFSEFGEVEYCAHLSDRDDPSRKRGFGFVTFGTNEAAEAAVENLDGLEVDGRGIRVNIAQPKAF
eukprot:CAMPEP_0171631572 /NCGR_PEP_ID=MMETSP0990-20121206/23751_1 /TAXON_ID=483369 /ORGANISM="non described non described, Strain CCMP2098" /LENGTH=253 /DNA_ID=CAMNT_0012201251 /DNA_START=45 /DNA_END=806 /DNA_ORIENTATION=-